MRNKPCFTKSSTSLLVSCLLISSSATAEIGPIVITPMRSETPQSESPVPITVITENEIEASGAKNIAELLRGRRGLQVKDFFGNGNSATVDSRGFGQTATSNVLIMVDGSRLNSSSDASTPDLNTVALTNIERIEIIQGSAGVLYGNQAVGGVINIITKSTQPGTASIETSIGSYNARELRAHVSANQESLKYRLSGTTRRSDNYRDNNQTDYQNLLLRADLPLEQVKLSAEFQYTEDFSKIPGALFGKQPAGSSIIDEVTENRKQSALDYSNDFLDTETKAIKLSAIKDIADHSQLHIDYSQRLTDTDFQLTFRGSPGSVTTQDRDVKNLNLKYLTQFVLNDVSTNIVTGIDMEKTDYALLSSFGPQENDQTIDAYYIHANSKISPTVSVQAGWRTASADNDIIHGSLTTPVFNTINDKANAASIGAQWQATKNTRLYTRIDENYRFAKVDEHTNPVFLQPVGLKVQKGTTYEMGAETSQSTSSFSASLFQIDLTDEISFDTSGFSNINIDNTKRRGVTLDAHFSLNKKVDINLNTTHIDAEITGGPNQGNTVPLVAENTLRAGMHYKHSSKIDFSAEYHWIDDQYIGGDFSNSFDKLPSYSLINTNLSYSHQNWRIIGRINNVLDKQYIESASVGYDATIGTFGESRPAFFPSPERNFWLTAKYNFK